MMRWLWPAVVVVSSLGVSLCMLSDLQSPIRPLLAFCFFCLCPGICFIRLLRLSDWYIELTLAVGLSFGIDLGVSSVLVYASRWSPSAALAIVITISLIGAALDWTTASSGMFHRPSSPPLQSPAS